MTLTLCLCIQGHQCNAVPQFNFWPECQGCQDRWDTICLQLHCSDRLCNGAALQGLNMFTMISALVHMVFLGGMPWLRTHMSMVGVFAPDLPYTSCCHVLNVCPRGSLLLCHISACGVYLQCPWSSNIYIYISISPTPRLGCVVSSANNGLDVGKIWWTHLDSQFLKTKIEPVLLRQMVPWLLLQVLLEVTTLPRQVTVDLPTRTLAEIWREVYEKTVQAPQPYILTIPTRN